MFSHSYTFSDKAIELATDTWFLFDNADMTPIGSFLRKFKILHANMALREFFTEHNSPRRHAMIHVIHVIGNACMIGQVEIFIRFLETFNINSIPS